MAKAKSPGYALHAADSDRGVAMISTPRGFRLENHTDRDRPVDVHVVVGGSAVAQRVSGGLAWSNSIARFVLAPHEYQEAQIHVRFHGQVCAPHVVAQIDRDGSLPVTAGWVLYEGPVAGSYTRGA